MWITRGIEIRKGKKDKRRRQQGQGQTGQRSTRVTSPSAKRHRQNKSVISYWAL